MTLDDGHTEVWKYPAHLNLWISVHSHLYFPWSWLCLTGCGEGSRLRLLTSAEFSVADPCLRPSLLVLEVAQRPGTLPHVPPQTALNVTSILAEDQQSFLQASWWPWVW